jgi:hypothetical protein
MLKFLPGLTGNTCGVFILLQIIVIDGDDGNFRLKVLFVLIPSI